MIHYDSVQEIKNFSETPATVHVTAKLCMNDSKEHRHFPVLITIHV